MDFETYLQIHIPVFLSQIRVVPVPEEFWSEHFVSNQFSFSCRLFVKHPVCTGLYWDQEGTSG